MFSQNVKNVKRKMPGVCGDFIFFCVYNSIYFFKYVFIK